MVPPSRRWLAPFCPSLGVALLLLGVATGVSAQAPQTPPGQPPPTGQPPPPRQPPPGEETDAATEPVGRQPWQFSVAALGGFETNIDFQPGTGIDDWATAVRGSLGRGWRWPRGQFSFSMNGTGVRYFDERAAARGDGSAGMAWGQQLSPRVRFSLTAGGSGGTTTSQTLVNELGQVLPRARAWNYGGGSGLDFKLGRRGSFRVSGLYTRVTFDDPALLGSQSMTGQASLSRQLGANDDISINYGYHRTESEGRPPLDNHTGTLGWDRKLSRHFSMGLRVGVGYNPPEVGAIEQAWYFNGSGSLSGHWRRATLSLQVGQAVTPSYGLGGNTISDTASLSVVLPFGRRVQLSLRGGQTWARSPSGNQTPYYNASGTASLGIGLTRNAGLEMGYNYRRRKPEDGEGTYAQRGYFGFTYSLP